MRRVAGLTLIASTIVACSVSKTAPSPGESAAIRAVPAGTAPANRAASVSINLASTAFAGGTGRTIVLADNNVGGAPMRAFVLADR